MEEQECSLPLFRQALVLPEVQVRPKNVEKNNTLNSGNLALNMFLSEGMALIQPLNIISRGQKLVKQ